METVAIRSRETGLPTDGMWDAGPVEVALSVLAAWKVPDGEVKRLTERAAVTAGSYGASYEQLGAVWGITRQGAREVARCRQPPGIRDSGQEYGGALRRDC